MEDVQKLRHRTIELVTTLPNTLTNTFIKLASLFVFKVHIDQELAEHRLQNAYKLNWRSKNRKIRA